MFIMYLQKNHLKTRHTTLLKYCLVNITHTHIYISSFLENSSYVFHAFL